MKIFNRHIRVPFTKQTEIYKEGNTTVVAKTVETGILRLLAYRDNELFKLWAFQGDGLLDFRSLGAKNQTKIAKHLLSHGVYHRTASVTRTDLQSIAIELNLSI